MGQSTTQSLSSTTLPAAPTQGIDWRTRGAVAPVYDQGPCDSPDVIVSVHLVQSAHFISTGKLETLSMQQLNDCIVAPGCAAVKAGESLQYISKYGIMRESDYTPDGGKCNYDASKVAVNIKTEI
jgi:cathepsin F